MKIFPVLFAVPPKHLLKCAFGLVGLIGCGLPALSSPYDLSDTLKKHSQPFILPNKEQYQIATAQVLSEICPALLTVKQKAQFQEAYQNQLKIFMPSSNDPNEALKQLASQKDYRATLQSVRAWTATFSASDNLVVCQQFAQSSIVF